MAATMHVKNGDNVGGSFPVSETRKIGPDGFVTEGPLPVAIGGSVGNGATAFGSSGLVLAQADVLTAILVELRVLTTILREGLETSDTLDALRNDENRFGANADA